MIFETIVSSPTRSTAHVIVPSTTSEPAKTFSPTPRETGSNSPVMGAWLMTALPETIEPSAQIFSPVWTTNKSETRKSAAPIFSSDAPSLLLSGCQTVSCSTESISLIAPRVRFIV